MSDTEAEHFEEMQDLALENAQLLDWCERNGWEIEDTGGGVAPDVIDHIFDPFFTTKDRGSGLGLSIAHKIVAQHNGRLSAENRPTGTRFKLTLDRAAD